MSIPRPHRHGDDVEVGTHDNALLSVLVLRAWLPYQHLVLSSI